MIKIIDITGQKFNRLTAVKFIKIDIKYNINYFVWEFKCDCGNKKVIQKNAVTSGHVKSCGCAKIDNAKKMGNGNITHNMRHSRIYSIWSKMKDRCLNENIPAYKDYGGRGIKVCDRWLESFENFRDDMYESYLEHVKKFGEKQTTIDRIDNNGNYCKENCRWATKIEQANNVRNNIYIDYKGKKLKLFELSNIFNIPTKRLYRRIFIYKWDIDKALKLPVNKGFLLTYNNQTLSLSGWERKVKIGRKTIIKRIRKGWSVEKALTTLPLK